MKKKDVEKAGTEALAPRVVDASSSEEKEIRGVDYKREKEES